MSILLRETYRECMNGVTLQMCILTSCLMAYYFHNWAQNEREGHFGTVNDTDCAHPPHVIAFVTSVLCEIFESSPRLIVVFICWPHKLSSLYCLSSRRACFSLGSPSLHHASLVCQAAGDVLGNLNTRYRMSGRISMSRRASVLRPWVTEADTRQAGPQWKGDIKTKQNFTSSTTRPSFDPSTSSACCKNVPFIKSH